MSKKWLVMLSIIFASVFIGSLAWAHGSGGIVTITPLGTHTGEFCGRDRALLFEDPEGTTVLYDVGRTVLGAGDPRLPAGLDVILLSGVHGDHIGDRRAIALNQGTCASPSTPLSTSPNTNTAEILAGFPGAKMFAGGEVRDFMRAKVAAAGGSSAQVDVLRHGGKRVVGGVTIAVVTAQHSNGVGRNFLTDPEKSDLAPDGLTAYVGPENGFVLTFSNGLAVYLSGDTGHISDMKHIVRDYYNAQVAIVNMGDIFSMGPEEAAFAVNKLIKPRTTIPTHANQGSTSGGVVVPGSRVETFTNLIKKAKVIVPLSGVAIRCDGHGRCTQD